MEIKNVNGKLKDWLEALQTERKCTVTNAVVKFVNQQPDDVQNEIVKFMAAEISDLISNAQDPKIIRQVCAVLNGCFDNFTHAADAVGAVSKKVFIFLTHVLSESCKYFR